MPSDLLGLPPDTLDYSARLVIATLLGGIIGIEREAKDRPAGLRTHMMISLAAALFTILTLELQADFDRRDPNANTDPLRIIEAVTAGVAFLAAGAIIQGRGQVHGLTTGAGMWLSGAVGVACGAEYYVMAVVAVVLATIVLALLRPLERVVSPNGRHKGARHKEGPQKDVEDSKPSPPG